MKCLFHTCSEVLEREQLVGMIKKNDPKRLLKLLATASCVGSTLYPCSLPNCFAHLGFQNSHSLFEMHRHENPPNDKTIIYPIIEIGMIVSIDSPTVSNDGT